MIRISKLADYATQIMCQFLNHPGPHCAQHIAEQAALPTASTQKILKALLKHQLLTSKRGAKGGYQLAKPANEITIANIIEAIDGPFALTDCCNSLKNCSLIAHCHTQRAWQSVNTVIHQALNAINLIDFTENNAVSIPVKHIKIRRKTHV